MLIDVSVGIGIFPDDAETPESLRKHAFGRPMPAAAMTARLEASIISDRRG